MKTLALALVAPLLLSANALAEKPAAVQVCVHLPHGASLLSSVARRNYRTLDESNYVLDLDLDFGGRAPERLAKVSANCVRAYVQPGPVGEIHVGFSRTDLNLKPESRAVGLKLKADLFYDGGSFEISRGTPSRVSTAMPGTLSLQRMEKGEWAKGPRDVADLDKVPSGRYRVRYAAPVPGEGSCPIEVTAEAIGTVREDNRPQRLAELVASYRRDVAPAVARALKATCTAGQALQMRVRLVDGAFRNPMTPVVEKVTRFDKQERYELVVDGERASFVDGEEIDIGFGQAIVLEPQGEKRLALSETAAP